MKKYFALAASIVAIAICACSCNKEENLVNDANFTVNVTAGTESSNPVMNIQQTSGDTGHSYKFKVNIDGQETTVHDEDVPEWVFDAKYTNEKKFILPTLEKGTHEISLTFYSGEGKIDSGKKSKVVTTTFTVGEEPAPVFTFWNGNGFPSEPVYINAKAFSKTTSETTEDEVKYENVSLVSALVTGSTIELYPYSLRGSNFSIEFSDPSRFTYNVCDNNPGPYFLARKGLTISAKGKTASYPVGEYTATITWGSYSETFTLVKNTKTKVEN